MDLIHKYQVSFQYWNSCVNFREFSVSLMVFFPLQWHNKSQVEGNKAQQQFIHFIHIKHWNLVYLKSHLHE